MYLRYREGTLLSCFQWTGLATMHYTPREIGLSESGDREQYLGYPISSEVTTNHRPDNTMSRKFRHSYTHWYFVLRSIQVSSLAGYRNPSPTEFCVNNTTSKGRVWFLIAFGSTYFMSREIWLKKVYFRCRINTSYRKLLPKLKVDEKVKQKIILNIKMSGKYLSQWHTIDRLLLDIFLATETSYLQPEKFFVIFLVYGLWCGLFYGLPQANTEMANLQACHSLATSPLLLNTLKFLSHFISLSAVLVRPLTSNSY